MSKIIGITKARSVLKKILDDVSKKKELYILTRGSKPEAVIIPYEKYQTMEELEKKVWDERFEKALKKSRNFFEKWLKERGYEPENLTEEEVERIIRGA